MKVGTKRGILIGIIIIAIIVLTVITMIVIYYAQFIFNTIPKIASVIDSIISFNAFLIIFFKRTPNALYLAVDVNI